jgi:hypothetical protein
MTEIIKRNICDVCKKEVNDFAGYLELKYSGRNCMGDSYPVEVVYEDICIDCCRKLHKAIEEVLEGRDK